MIASSNEEGFSLPEVLITMGILSIGLLALAGVATGIIKSNAFSRNVTTATAIAREKMEEIRGQGYPPLLTMAHKTTEEYGVMDRYPAFKRIVRVHDVGGTEDRIKEISVVVYWDGDTHHAQLDTIMGE